ncbi:MAG: 4Fe-4S dicluster domain-containing protein, partial [Candidatus Brockarchaeota archaeon]|nr:4Fe-4S dicluster domain-containing protein [Candidatus Brockarchaeota archaeon]
SFTSIPFRWTDEQTGWKGEQGKIAVFGVNAISAEDGTVFFLEHSRNITKGLREAAHIVLLVGLEKVVRNRDEALFQTLCTGLFGFEGISSELKLQSASQVLPFKGKGQGHNPRVSIILLNNGRTAIREKFKEFLYCIGCRTCNAVCPSFLVYKSVFEGPRSWLKMFNEAFKNSNNVVARTEMVWACRTCKSCEKVCPFEINHVEKFIKIREQLVETGRIPSTLRDILKSTFLHGNPWGRARNKRDAWSEGLGIDTFDGHEILYYIGCMASYDPRCQEMAKSLSKVFKKVGVRFGILGKEETCCGAEIRRIGESGLFEELAKQNKEIFKKKGVKKIITASPHCFNTFKNEYNADFDVLHYTQFLAGVLNKIEPKKEINSKVAYHDPCYLGRHNNVYEEPRKILASIPGLKIVEIEPNRENSFCCGGGGGHMWFEWPRKPRPSELRIKQALEAGVDTVAVACPFCLSMLDDAVKTLGCENRIKVKDISELVAEAITVH